MRTPNPPPQGLALVPDGQSRQFAHKIKNLLSPAALYLDSVLLRETGLGERSREQLLAVQTVIDQVCRELEALRDGSGAPTAVPTAPEHRPSGLQQDDSVGLRVLLVDDDPMLLSSLERTLGFDRHSVQCAGSAELGLQMAANAHANGQAFEVVITDLSMQGMDGQELARTLKARGLAGHVILLTGWGGATGGEQPLPEGVDQWLAKPPRLVALRQALQRVAPRIGRG